MSYSIDGTKNTLIFVKDEHVWVFFKF